MKSNSELYSKDTKQKMLKQRLLLIQIQSSLTPKFMDFFIDFLVSQWQGSTCVKFI